MILLKHLLKGVQNEYWLLVLTLTALAGCKGVESRPVAGDQSGNHVIYCHSLNGSADKCHQKAEKICTKSYSVIHSASNVLVHTDGDDGIYMPPKHELTVKCNP